MFHTKSQPKLQGKAGEVKDLGPVMVMVWEKHMNPNLLIHQKILLVLKGFSLSLQLCVFRTLLFVFRTLCLDNFVSLGPG